MHDEFVKLSAVDSPGGDSSACGELWSEVRYLRALCERNASHIIASEIKYHAARHELEQKRLGFHLMSELAMSMVQTDDESIFTSVGRRINATLKMDRTAILFPHGDEGVFRATVLHGYARHEKESIASRDFAIDYELLDMLHPVLVTSEDSPDAFREIRQGLSLPFFVSSPVIIGDETLAILVAGRLKEHDPFISRLGQSDAESIQTVSGYLAAVIAGHRLRHAEEQAKHDPLTQLPNLRGVHERVRQLLSIARRNYMSLAVMFVDLDNFKHVNDTLGHAAGDLVLRTMAERMKRGLREADMVGRIGGDEFVVILSQIRKPEDAGLVARNILKRVRQPIRAGGDVCEVGASVGIAIFPNNGDNESELINAADEAMYSVKNEGKNNIAFASGKRKKTSFRGKRVK